MDVFRFGCLRFTWAFLIGAVLSGATVCILSESGATEPSPAVGDSCQAAEVASAAATHPSCEAAAAAGPAQVAESCGYPSNLRDRFRIALEMVLRVDFGARQRALKNLVKHSPSEASRAAQLAEGLADLERGLPEIDRALTFRETAALAAADVVLDTVGRTDGYLRYAFRRRCPPVAFIKRRAGVAAPTRPCFPR